MRTPRADPLSSTSSPSSSSQTQHQTTTTRVHQSPRAPPPTRYHINHFDTGGMPVSLWGMDRRDVWRTCFCFHVRTVTIFIGVWYLMMYILALSFHAALLMYEPGQDGFSGGMTVRPEPMLPTPVSNTGAMPPKPVEIPKPESLTIDNSEHHRARVDNMRSGPLTLVLDTSRKATSQVILLTVCNMLITLLMVYGAVRGKPSYLMPFFVLRVFDFCIFCLTMVGYFSYLPNVTEGIMNTQGMPFRDEFLRMDPQLLSFITLIFIVAFIAVKAYIIGVIWNCYKYLMLRNTVIRGVIAYRHDDPTSIMGLQQNLLPDLPDYETAVNDPRYAKKPPPENGQSHPPHTMLVTGGPTTQVGLGVVGMNNSPNLSSNIAMPPPPPYSVAVASEPLHLVIPISGQNLNNNMIDANASNATVTVPQQQPAVISTTTTTTVTEQIQTSGAVDAPTETEEIQTSPIFVPVLPQHLAAEVQQQESSAPVIAADSVPTASHHHHQ
ncbi:Lysosomal-associated transmembrane protein 4A [Orchesella cincta]|uniref:Lysosomal-associated transmembrane protein 4A n=1 Tax=Orchesella cincta TaxID=48709 RepID=A0A1D2MP43_ORCCI|nr:Lysosomal-associated transmembrane protein 4A [Orchesella cincta]